MTEYESDAKELTENAVNEFRMAERREAARNIKRRISHGVLSSIEEILKQREFDKQFNYLEE